MRTISFNDNDSAVYDVQCRLRALGYELETDSFFGEKTRAAVQEFRKSQNLPEADTVDETTWNALVDATFTLGDRILYLRMPYFHGQDVFILQDILNVLGFITDEKDGIFGAHTEKALREFQASAGIIDDGIAGASTFDAIERLRHAWEDKQAAEELLDEQNHAGLARAFEALQNMEACFYGLDVPGRTVAARIANLAQATSETARVTCADELGGIPHQTMLLVGLVTSNAATNAVNDAASITFSTDFAFTKRLSTALKAIETEKSSRRLVIEIPQFSLENGAGVPNIGVPKQSAASESAQGTKNTNTKSASTKSISTEGATAEKGKNAASQDEISQEQWYQHLAVLLLDAFCAVFSQ